ncbi:MAG TPA: hypothetical protein VMJ30_03910 [Gemmatimonadales bacterium]|nr:hypothetical protein [Gemmatimonadales bacterium]
MDVAVISGLFAIAGAVAGWSLNQIGLRLARRTEQRESNVRDADHRVFAAATAATRFGEAVRWLVQIDWGKNVAGQGPSHATYEQMVVEAQSELRRLREALLGITVKGPNGSAAELERIITSAQELWDGMLAASRQSIGEEPQPWLLACGSLVAVVQSWAQQHSSPPRPRAH